MPEPFTSVTIVSNSPVNGAFKPIPKIASTLNVAFAGPRKSAAPRPGCRRPPPPSARAGRGSQGCGARRRAPRRPVVRSSSSDTSTSRWISVRATTKPSPPLSAAAAEDCDLPFQRSLEPLQSPRPPGVRRPRSAPARHPDFLDGPAIGCSHLRGVQHCTRRLQRTHRDSLHRPQRDRKDTEKITAQIEKDIPHSSAALRLRVRPDVTPLPPPCLGASGSFPLGLCSRAVRASSMAATFNVKAACPTRSTRRSRSSITDSCTARACTRRYAPTTAALSLRPAHAAAAESAGMLALPCR